MVYESYGTTKLHLIQEDAEHYFGPGKMEPGLRQIYADLGYVSSTSDFNEPQSNYWELGDWINFDQKEFVDTSAIPFEASEFREAGKVFIPQGCYSRACKLHVAFHACDSNSDQLAWYAQYNELAASNDMIVLYPDSKCFNVGNFDQEKWLTNEGLYDRAFIAMIERLTSYQREGACTAGSVDFTAKPYLYSFRPDALMALSDQLLPYMLLSM